MTEQYLQSKFLRFLDKCGIYFVKTISCSHAGVPDILACINGQFWAVECKTEIGRESALQVYNSKGIRRAGGRYFVLRPSNYREICAAIEKYLALYPIDK
jgi:hypothetical protein